jgi:hypothetical protein
MITAVIASMLRARVERGGARVEHEPVGDLARGG